MAFIVPTFNIQCNIWRHTQWVTTWPPIVAAPSIANQDCQLRGYTKNLTVNPFVIASNLEELVLPKGTDIRGPALNTTEYEFWMEVVEVPSGSGRYYLVLAVADQAKGFSNEYRSAAITPTWTYEGTVYNAYPHWPWTPAWPTPYP